MASKAREALEKDTSGESRICSSGVKIWVKPMPAILLRRLEQRLNKEFPDPMPPKKTITVLDGTEEVDDLNNPDYVAAKRTATESRLSGQFMAMLDFCVETDGGIEAYEDTIARIEKRTGEPYPTDLEERRIQFLSEYVVRSGVDWQIIFASAIGQTQATDPEVSAQIDSFRNNVARPETNGASSSGSTKKQRVAV